MVTTVMKRIFILAIGLLMTVFSAVNCSYQIEDVDFSVSLSQDNVYAPREEIVFNLHGNPDYVTFWSGESGCRYEYAGTVDEEGNANFGIPVKSMNARETTFSYTYTMSGVYDVVFEAKNSSFGHEKVATIRLQIEIK